MTASKFNLEIELQLLEKTLVYKDNKFRKGAYQIAFLPSLTYFHEKCERILDKIVYEVNTVRGTELNEVRTVSFKILKAHSNPINLDDVEIKGIDKELLKEKIEEFVESMECVVK